MWNDELQADVHGDDIDRVLSRHGVPMRRLSLPLLIIASLAACAHAPGPVNTGGHLPPEVAGITWQWVSMIARTGEVRPDAPEHYTVRFGDDNRAQIRADCNTGSAPIGNRRRTTLARVEDAPGCRLAFLRWSRSSTMLLILVATRSAEIENPEHQARAASGATATFHANPAPPSCLPPCVGLA
jgi:hypothetical protein